MSDEENQNSAMVCEEDGVDLLEMLGILLRNKYKIIIITLIGALGSIIFSIGSLLLPPEKSYLPNLYTSSAKLLINNDSSSSLLPSGVSDLASLAGVNVGGGASYGALAADLAVSNPIVDKIVEEFGILNRYEIKKYPKFSSREAIRERLSSVLNEDTGVLTISYKDWNPKFSMMVVNRVVELLDDRFYSIGVNRSITQKNLLEEKLVNVNSEIARIEKNIKDFQEKYGVLSVNQIAEAQVTGIASLKSQLILKELEIETYSQFSRIEDPVLSRMKSERNNLETLINQMEKGENAGNYSTTGPSMKDLPDLALEFSHIQRELLVQAEIYKLLTQQLEMTKLKVEGEGPIFQILELGDLSDKKSQPSRSIICVAVTFCFFFIAAMLVIILNKFSNIRKNPKRMAKLN